MDKSVRLIMKDELYRRMLAIILSEKGYTVLSEDGAEDEPVCSVTDKENFPLHDSKKGNFIVVDYGERDENIPKSTRYFSRPTDADEIVDTLETFSGNTPEEKKEVLSLDKKNKSARLGKKAVKLTDTEFSLLLLLYEKKGSLVTTEEINEKLWDGNEKKTNAPVVYVNFLRKKFEESFGQRMIVCVRNKGYILK